MGPTSYGDSPYQSFSAFAGNPYFIDLDFLVKEKLIEKSFVSAYSWGEKDEDVDYATIYNHRFQVLKEAYKNSMHKEKADYKKFCDENSFWLEDYSFYMALKSNFHNKEWSLWDDEVRFRVETVLEKYKKNLSDEIDFWKFCQYKFNEQWIKLKSYTNQKGIKIIGDIPLYVSMDSADVWVHGRLFELDEMKNPINVAGVPPDAFSKNGQRWGNPLYDWEAMEQEDYLWWRERMKFNAKLYDVIRIDHFIGIVRYYGIPSSSETALVGMWRKGPGSKLTDAIKESIGESHIIAEDLGLLVPSVKKLIKKTGWPGMKILLFAFDGNINNEYLPHNFSETNCIIYGGTHDNETIAGFFSNKKAKELEYLYKYMRIKKKKDIPDQMIRLAYSSIAKVAIFQMQDILGLDNRARMNLPATVGNNWRWRMTKDQFCNDDMKRLKELSETYGR